MDTNTQTPVQAPISSSTSSTPPQVPFNPTDHTTIINNDGNKKVGPIIAILVIVLVLVIAALYLFASRLNKEPAETSTVQTSNETIAQESVEPVTSTSDDMSSIESDLNASTNGLDNQNF